MSENDTRIARLREKAANLPNKTGVYIMENSAGKIIYVGKSRSLRDRVYQYFVGTHDAKTAKMASLVNDFRFITCETEIESLALENLLIKKHTPRYNIRLKDAKSYPYIKLTAGSYPRLAVTRKRENDGGQYFGPYSGVKAAYSITEMLERTFGLPSCKKRFPEDIGKGRPCMYYQTGRCRGLCSGNVSVEEHAESIALAKYILRGHTTEAVQNLRERMFECSEAERYEEAARCRDTINALERLKDRQTVVGRPGTECDVISFARVYVDKKLTECATVFYIRDGGVSDTEHFLFGDTEVTGLSENDEAESPITAFIISLYQGREYIPHEILISSNVTEKDTVSLSEYLTRLAGRSVTVRVPLRGDGKRLCELAAADAERHIENVEKRVSREERSLAALATMLSLEVLPERIEAYDISNIGHEHITAGMVVYENAKPKKSDYRYFKIKTTQIQDDYASMREALIRRFEHLGDSEGSFSKKPDLILLDGGAGHLSVVLELLRELSLDDINVCGMVKDSHHKTRALVTPQGEVSIAKRDDVFRLIYGIQEEVHRFTVSKMSNAKRKTLKRSTLEEINGIGAAKVKKLYAAFGKLTNIKNASVEDLSAVGGISKTDAQKIYEHYHGKKGDM